MVRQPEQPRWRSYKLLEVRASQFWLKFALVSVSPPPHVGLLNDELETVLKLRLRYVVVSC